jgi:hypothetical protein
MVQLICNLTVDAPSAAARGQGVLAGVTFEAVLLTDLASKKQKRDARRNAGEQPVEQSTFSGSSGILTEKATSAEGSEQACFIRLEEESRVRNYSRNP